MWKDLGTWNALVEELSDISTGDVIAGNHVEESKIFNELNISVVCECVKDPFVDSNRIFEKT